MTLLPDPATTVLGAEYKSLPPRAWGLTVAQLIASAPSLSDFQTPVLTIDRSALAHNTATMATWSRARGVLLAPHGKTTMAPALWQSVLNAGAWGLTFATPWQAQVARSAGVQRILLANELVDPVAVDWLARELERDPHFEFICWVDSVEGVRRLETLATSSGMTRRLDVLVELGVTGGRTGARTVDDGLTVADAIAASPQLRLRGVGGYEGAAAHDRSPAALARVRGFLQSLLQLHQTVAHRFPFADSRPIVTAGGSAYFDLVVEVLGGEPPTSDVILRSGAYQVHDDGFYSQISPFGVHSGALPRFTAAVHGWARVLSRPERDLAILDAGKRDLPYDEGLPVPQRSGQGPDHRDSEIVAASTVTALNDQHLFLRLPGGAMFTDLPIGTVVRFGISHPCTAFDKWRAIPLIDDSDAADPQVVGLIETLF
jgi:D-serine deaminase-like pyridoxal phosphate-dependent protein